MLCGENRKVLTFGCTVYTFADGDRPKCMQCRSVTGDGKMPIFVRIRTLCEITAVRFGGRCVCELNACEEVWVSYEDLNPNIRGSDLSEILGGPGL
jgi:hypothetical protein